MHRTRTCIRSGRQPLPYRLLQTTGITLKTGSCEPRDSDPSVAEGNDYGVIARSLLQQFVATYAGRAPKAVVRLEAGFDDAMAVLALPEPYRCRLRTTNSLERPDRGDKGSLPGTTVTASICSPANRQARSLDL